MVANSAVRAAEATSEAIKPYGPAAVHSPQTDVVGVRACLPRSLMALVYCHAHPPSPTLESRGVLVTTGVGATEGDAAGLEPAKAGMVVAMPSATALTDPSSRLRKSERRILSYFGVKTYFGLKTRGMYATCGDPLHNATPIYATLTIHRRLP